MRERQRRKRGRSSAGEEERVGVDTALQPQRERERGTCGSAAALAPAERLLATQAATTASTGLLLPLPVLLPLLLWLLYSVLRSRDPVKAPSLVQTSELPREDVNGASNGAYHYPSSVKFLAWRTPDFRLLHKGLELHRRGQHLALEGLSHQLNVALQTEHDHGLGPILSTQIQAKLNRLADLYERDQHELEKVLVPFPVALTLPASSPSSSGGERGWKNGTASKGGIRPHQSDDDHPPVRYFSTRGIPGNDYGITDNTASSSSYDTVAQIVAHLVRDWSLDGLSIRTSLYGWCVDRVQRHVPAGDSSILVPGAGLGRLAYDLATTPSSLRRGSAHSYHVHAIENSLLMASAAAHVLLHRTSPGGKRVSEDVPALVVLHPYASDPFTNELHSERRYQAVEISREHCSIANDSSNNDDVQDHDANPVPSRSSLSYTIGDFATVVSHGPQQSYHAVVTCFFLDTSNNVLEFVVLIKQLLVSNTGVWINVGPLQWHRNAQVSVTGDELRELLETSGFDILEWSVDQTPMEYRSEEHSNDYHPLSQPQRGRSSTHYEAFYPLRFVARLVGST